MELEHRQNLFSIWYAGRTKLSWIIYRLLCRLENEVYPISEKPSNLLSWEGN